MKHARTVAWHARITFHLSPLNHFWVVDIFFPRELLTAADWTGGIARTELDLYQPIKIAVVSMMSLLSKSPL